MAIQKTETPGVVFASHTDVTLLAVDVEPPLGTAIESERQTEQSVREQIANHSE